MDHHVNLLFFFFQRRIAAMTLAHRVAAERDLQVHGQVGYHIGGKRGYTSATRLLYVTTGILLKMLKADRCLNMYTHVIMDEVHILINELIN